MVSRKRFRVNNGRRWTGEEREEGRRGEVTRTDHAVSDMQ